MLKRLLLSVATILVALSTHAEVSSVTLANGEWPPYLSEKLPYNGSVSRIVSEAFASEGITVHYQFFPWKRALEEARHGNLDGTVVWTKTADRENSFLFSKEVLASRTVFFYRKAKPVQWSQLADLAPLMLGGTLGYNYGAEFDKLEKSGALKVERIPSDEQNLAKLLAGRIDAFPIDIEVGMYMLDLHHGKDGMEKLAAHPKTVVSEPLYLMISRKSPNADILMKHFNAGLAKLRANGKYEQYMREGRSAK